MQNDTGQYSSAMKVMHWFMAFLLLSMIAMGVYMTDLERGTPLRDALYSLHKSFGVTLLFLAVLRIVIRLNSVKPQLPPQVDKMEKRAASTTYLGMYALMIIIPLSGYSMSTLFGLPVRWFGMELPRLLPIDRDLAKMVAEWHELFAYGLLALVGLHLAGFLKHLIFDKLNLLKRMW